jgi:cell wall-associated NlpC family hydrolase
MFMQKKQIGIAFLFLLVLSVPGLLFAQSDFKHPVLLVKNGLDAKITEVFLSDSDMSDWGANILPKPIIPGLAHQFTLQKSLKTARLYDVSVKDEKGDTYSKYNVDIMALTLVVMTPADKESVTPPPSTGQTAPSSSGTAGGTSAASKVAAAPVSSGNANRTITDDDALRQKIVTTAKKYMGVPYVLGAPKRPIVEQSSNPRGLDCSGFIAQVYKDVTGVTIPSQSRTMFDNGKKIEQNQLKPGDIIVMDSSGKNSVNHVALYIGPDVAFQALSEGPRTGIVETKVPGIRAAKILGYRTFVGTTSGNKQNYNPTTGTDYSFDITSTPSTENISFGLQANSTLRFKFDNTTGKTMFLMYRFFKEGEDPLTGENETFTLKPDESFTSNFCIPKTAGKYRLQVYTGSLLLLERIWTVAN